jgi:hypothetical protein
MADDIKKHADELEQQAKDIQEALTGWRRPEVKIDEDFCVDGRHDGRGEELGNCDYSEWAGAGGKRRSQSAIGAGNSASWTALMTDCHDREAVARALLTCSRTQRQYGIHQQPDRRSSISARPRRRR